MRVLTVSPAAARSAIARGWLGTPERDDARLGSVELRPHQLRALGRLRRSMAEFGGALLADAVGLGKTHVALALARGAGRTLVVAPAALRSRWRRAAADAAVPVDFASFESLGRAPRAGTPPAPRPPDLVVVDEAHHARNPATRRYRRLAALTAHARVLLLTATPVHNSRRDLSALLALFLGERADRLDASALARLLVRRTPRDLGWAGGGAADPEGRGTDAAPTTPASTPPPAPLPAVRPTRWLHVPDAPAVLAALRAVPPAVPPADGGDAGALTAIALVHLWASSDAAVRAALRRRLARAAALAAALEQGRHLTRAALRRSALADDVVQLELALDPAAPPPDGARLLDSLRAHERGLRRALDALESGPTGGSARDGARAALLRAIRRRHPGAHVVAFTRFAHTARALFRLLAPDGGAGLLTARGGRVAGGPIPRHELVARFAPRASGVPPPRAAHRVDLLLATDCLSEGLDLHDASVVVHLDVPWTPARLAQRVGRAARLGSPHAAVAVYALAPPGGAAAWLRLGARLRRKALAARRAVGARTRDGGDGARAAVRTAALLERWAATPPPPPDGDGDPPVSPDDPRAPRPVLLAAAARSAEPGLVALCLDHGRPVLVAGRRGRLTTAPRAVLRALRLAARAGAPVPLAGADVRRPLRLLHRWARRRDAVRLAGADPAVLAPAPRALVARADRILADAPPHRRPALAPLAAALRAALQRPVGAGRAAAVAELDALADDRWLPAVVDAVRAAPPAPAPADAAGFRVVTILLLRP